MTANEIIVEIITTPTLGNAAIIKTRTMNTIYPNLIQLEESVLCHMSNAINSVLMFTHL